MRSTSLLRGMTDAELDPLMTCFGPRVRRYAKGELLLMAGYETHELGLVLEGEITASKPLPDGGTVVIAPWGRAAYLPMCWQAAAATAPSMCLPPSPA